MVLCWCSLLILWTSLVICLATGAKKKTVDEEFEELKKVVLSDGGIVNFIKEQKKDLRLLEMAKDGYQEGGSLKYKKIHSFQGGSIATGGVHIVEEIITSNAELHFCVLKATDTLFARHFGISVRKEAHIMRYVSKHHRDKKPWPNILPEFYNEYKMKKEASGPNKKKEISQDYIIAMEYIPSGLVGTVERAARFYAGVLILALEELWTVFGVRHDDVKLENVRLKENGYPILIDLNIAFIKGHDVDTDNVPDNSFFELQKILRSPGRRLAKLLICLLSPSKSAAPKWSSSEQKWEWPPGKKLSDQAKDFFDRASKDKLDVRLGHKNRFVEFRQHPWFKDTISVEDEEGVDSLPPFDFSAALHQEMPAPYLPLKSQQNSPFVSKYRDEYHKKEIQLNEATDVMIGA